MDLISPVLEPLDIPARYVIPNFQGDNLLISSYIVDFEQNRDCDVMLACNDSEPIYAHKRVLSCYSMYFKKVFEQVLPEMFNYTRVYVVQLSEKVEMIRLLIRLIYYGDTQVEPNMKKNFELILTKYDVDACEWKLVKATRPKNSTPLYGHSFKSPCLSSRKRLKNSSPFRTFKSNKKLRRDAPFANLSIVELVSQNAQSVMSNSESPQDSPNQSSPGPALTVIKSELQSLSTDLSNDGSSLSSAANSSTPSHGSATQSPATEPSASTSSGSSCFKMAATLPEGYCAICSKQYKHASSLLRHMNSKHKDATGLYYECHLCGLHFANCVSIQDHFLNDHDIAVDLTTKKLRTRRGPKPRYT
ncbi:hypothetical protein HDE_13897 [Halotydeus destructor]|nr:hypothetical protein HDE_13897 [Halotydeus destructor]